MGYSAAGQLSDRSISNGAYRYSVGAPVTTNYTANGLNQYASVGGTAYSYDARGNLTYDGSRNFGYNNGNELTGVSDSATIMTLAYDPAGRLRQTITPGGGAGTPTNWGAANWGAFQWSGATYVKRNFVYDGGALAVEYDDAGNIIRRYVPGQGADETLVWYEGSGLLSPHWLHTDEQGSVIATSDGSGNRTPYAYSATGEPTAWGSVGTDPAFRYTGQVALPQVRLMYYKARMYDPALGRFLQTDPAGYSQGLNLYAYVANNYPNATDPSGMCSWQTPDGEWHSDGSGDPVCETVTGNPNVHPDSGCSYSNGTVMINTDTCNMSGSNAIPRLQGGNASSSNQATRGTNPNMCPADVQQAKNAAEAGSQWSKAGLVILGGAWLVSQATPVGWISDAILVGEAATLVGGYTELSAGFYLAARNGDPRVAIGAALGITGGRIAKEALASSSAAKEAALSELGGSAAQNGLERSIDKLFGKPGC